MTIYFDPKTLGFYDSAFCAAPEGAVEVSKEERDQVLSGVSNEVQVGCVDGRPALVPRPGKTAEEVIESKRKRILEELLKIDMDSIRPLRALAVSPDSEDDTLKLMELEERAGALRASLAELEGRSQ